MLWHVRLRSVHLQNTTGGWNADDGDDQQLCWPRLLRVLRMLLLNVQLSRRRGQKFDERSRLATYSIPPWASICGRDEGI